MEKILYFGHNKSDLRLLRNWLEESCLLVQTSCPIEHLIEYQHPDEPELMLIDADRMTPENIGMLSRTIEMRSSAQLPPIILISDPLSEITGEPIPEGLWVSDAVDILFKPWSKQYLRKKIDLTFFHKRAILKGIQAQEYAKKCAHDREVAEDQLEQSAHENEALLQEIHHRVKNNLQIVSSILSFKTEEFDDPKVRDVLKIAISRVDAISLIHKQLYESNNLAKIDMHDYIEKQVRDLFYNYPTRSQNIELKLDVIHFTLEVSPAIHCALLINELILNVIFHAFPDRRAGNLMIRIQNHLHSQLRLVIQDDGVGLREDPRKMSTRSIGMRLIYQLTQQLNGVIRFHGDSGSCFEIIFPKSL